MKQSHARAKGLGLAMFAFAGAIGIALDAAAQESLTIANYGGTAAKASSDIIWQPLAKKEGVTIKEDTLSGVADVRTQVIANAVQWDIVEFTVDECATGAKEGLFEKIDKTPYNGFGLSETNLTDDYVVINSASYVLAWSKAKYGDNGPKSWADFWNTEKFPGTRALRNSPVHNLEAALMADGVAAKDVYPIDIERAFKKLGDIKPSISVWWNSGGQAAQLARDKEVDIIGIWNTRLQPIIDADDSSFGYTWDGGVLVADCYAIPKNAPNAELAKKIMPIAASPEYQALLANEKPISPTSRQAYELGLIKEEMLPKLPLSPQNRDGQVEMLGPWWADNGAEIQRRWVEFMQQ